MGLIDHIMKFIIILLVVICMLTIYSVNRQLKALVTTEWKEITDINDVDYIFFQRLNDKTECQYGIKCTNIASVQFIENAHLTRNGLVYDNDKKKYSFGYWFWKNKKLKFKKKNGYDYLKAFSFVRQWEQHFQHIVMGSYLKMSYFCNWIRSNRDMKIIVMNEIQKNILQHACKVDPDRYVIQTDELYIKELYVIHWISDENRIQGDILTIAASPVNIITMPEGNPNTLFYMPRARSLGKRFVENEKEVINFLKEYCEKFSLKFKIFDGNVNELINAAILIGPHGGAIANMIYTNRHAKVIEFIPLEGLKKRPCYILVANSLSIKYEYIEPDRFDFDNGGMIVNINILRDKLFTS